MKIAIAVFAKTIGLSEVKTRLATSIGKANAEAFYKRSVCSIEEVLNKSRSQTGEIFPHWVLAEEAAPDMKQWEGFPAIWTGAGDLGQRLANVSEKLFKDHDGVILIGTDSPQLSPEVFGQAVNILYNHPDDCVVGPASDGGFYLFGSFRAVERSIWQAVNYSVETTLFELIALTEQIGFQVHRLPVEQDVDVIEDLERLAVRLAETGQKLLPAQQSLLNWLNKRK